MVDWTSPTELARDAASNSKLDHVLAGIYFWEIFISLDFEWSFIRGKRRFNWPLIPYFLGRYFALGVILKGLIAANITAQINCQALETSSYIFGGSTFGFSTINLAIRTMVIWNMNLYCVVPLCLLCAAQWATIIQDIITVRAVWKPGKGCQVTQIGAYSQSASLIISVFVDFVVLTLSVFKLVVHNRGTGRRSQLVNILFRDGIIYFVVSLLVNIPAAVVALLRLNPVVDILTVQPAVIFSAIVACRVVRRLSNFSTDGPAIYMTATKPTLPWKVAKHPKVTQIQVDRLTHSDAPSGEAKVVEEIKINYEV